MAQMLVQLAISVAVNALLALIFPPKTIKQEGPRLNDTRMSVSTYGGGIPIGFGDVRLGGNVIWSSGIEEVKTVEEYGGKGGPPPVEQTTYSYFASLAICFSEGPAKTLQQLLFDNKLAFDSTGASENFWKYGSSAIRFYPGSTTQLPDPHIQEFEGVANTPAYRGRCYTVIDRLPLEDFGNRIPQINGRIDYNSTDLVLQNTIPNPGDTADKLWDDFDVDEGNRVGYGLKSGGVARIDLRNNIVTKFVTEATYQTQTNNGSLHPTALRVTGAGDLFMLCNVGTGPSFFSHELVRINAYTLDVEDDGPSIVTNKGGLALITRGSAVTVEFRSQSNVTGVGAAFIFATNTGSGGDGSGRLNIYSLREGFYDYQWSHDQTPGRMFLKKQIKLPHGGHPTNDGFILGDSCALGGGFSAWVGYDSSQTDSEGFQAKLVVLELEETAGDPFFGPNFYETETIIEIDADSSIYDGAIAAADAAVHRPQGIAYDPGSNSLFIFGSPVSDIQRIIQLDITTLEVINFIETNAVSGHTLQPYDVSKLKGPSVDHIHCVASGVVDTVVKMRTLDMVTEVVDIGVAHQEKSVQWDFFDRIGNSLLGSGLDIAGDGDLIRVLIDRTASVPEPLEDIITAIAVRAGYTAADLDLTDSGILSRDLTGYVLGSQMSVRQAMDPLTFGFIFDVVESDFVLKFISHGELVPTVTIPEEDLGARIGSGPAKGKQAQDKFIRIRGMEQEVPERLDLRYSDPERRQLEGNQFATRQVFPNPTMFSRSNLQVDLPIVMTADQAKQAVEVALYQRWINRTRAAFSLGPKYLLLDPTDVIDVVFKGITHTVRLIEAEMSGGMTVKMSAQLEDPSTSISVSNGTAQPLPIQTIDVPGRTELFLMETPILRDTDQDVAGSAGVYLAYGRTSGSWKGAATFSSENGFDWSGIDSTRVSAPWGFTRAELPALTPCPLGEYNRRITSWDRTSVLDIYLVDGETHLESKTELQVLNGANAIWVSGEIIQYATATDVGNGVWHLSTLLRGRRGTEVLAEQGHLRGVRVVFLSPKFVTRKFISLGQRNTTVFYRAQSIGASLDELSPQGFKLAGNSFKPYMPEHVRADAPSGATRDPVTVSWVRRTRFDLERDLEDALTDVTNENVADAEGFSNPTFEIVLMDPNGDQSTEKLSKQLVAAIGTDPSEIFSDAEQLAAGYSTGDPLNFAIYQLSITVGRGFPKFVTL